MKNNDSKQYPPGKVKIINALRALLETKDFGSIKIADIAETAGVTEPLIYKYFKDKRDVLHHLLQDYIENTLVSIANKVDGIKGALNKLQYLIPAYIHLYDADRVIARVVLLEVRNSTDYYDSRPYQYYKKDGYMMSLIIEQGIKDGEIRDDIKPKIIRDMIFGFIERSCLTHVIYKKPFDAETLSKDVVALVFDAITKK